MSTHSPKLDQVNACYVCKYNSIPWYWHVFYQFTTYHIIMNFFKECVRIKIEDQKILVLMSILPTKLDEVNTNYALKYCNSILWSFHVFHCISSIYHIIMYFFPKSIRIKIEDHNISNEYSFIKFREFWLITI